MAFSSRSNNYEKSAEVEFSKGSYRVIDIRLGASEEELSILYDGICDILDGTCAWYSPLSRIDLGFIVLAIIWVISVALSSDKPGAPSAPDINMTWEAAGIIGLVIVAGVILIGVFVWLMNRFRDRYFPIATFAIGQGIERYNFDEKIRWTIVIGFMVSLSASIVVSLI